MNVDGYSPLHIKRRRFTTTFDSMEAQAAAADAKARFAAVKEKFGRDIRVFETSPPSLPATRVPDDDETDDFYEFTADDYYRITTARKEDKFLKTRKIREAEEAVRRAKSRVTKAVIRVRFPDNHTLELTFQASETIQGLYDLLKKVLVKPELPLYLYTTPPKKQIKDLSLDFYSAGFAPGAIVHFSYDLSKGDAEAIGSGPFLIEEIMSLKGLDAMLEPTEPVQPTLEPDEAEVVPPAPAPAPQQPKPAEKKPMKPKWLKM